MIPIPGLAALRAIGIGLMVTGASTIGWGLLHFQPKGERIGEQRVRAEWAEAEVRRSKLALQAEQEQRARERREAVARQEVLDEAERLATRSRAAAAGAARADRVLGDAISVVVSGSGLRIPAAAPPAGGQAADQAAVVLADVLGRARARLRELGEFADDANAAGLTCERIADSVTEAADLSVYRIAEP